VTVVDAIRGTNNAPNILAEFDEDENLILSYPNALNLVTCLEKISLLDQRQKEHLETRPAQSYPFGYTDQHITRVSEHKARVAQRLRISEPLIQAIAHCVVGGCQSTPAESPALPSPDTIQAV
jgi:hypothetical protein